MVNVRQRPMPSNRYSIKCPYSMNAEFITIHNTANKASAEDEITYMINNNNSTSFHVAVDDVEIIECIPFNRNAWHAGDGNTGMGNRKSIGVEICYSILGGGKFEAAQRNAAEYTAHLLKQNNWGIDRLRKHQDWSGKFCPHRTLSDYGWDYFLNLVTEYLNINSIENIDIKTDTVDVVYQTWDDIKNVWLPNVQNREDYAGIFGHDVCAVYASLSKGNITYAVHGSESKKWYPAVTNRNDYAGVFNEPIDGLMMKTDSGHTLHYRVHLRAKNQWLPDVTGYDINDDNNGYAGVLGQEIDAVEIWLDPKITTIATSKPILTPTSTEVKEIYRVRQDWNDPLTQKGAYSSLDNAKEQCQNCGEGYKVYDWNGNEMYRYEALKVESESEVKPELNPELEVKPETIFTPTESAKPEDANDSDKINTIVTAIINILKKLAEIFLNKFKNTGE